MTGETDPPGGPRRRTNQGRILRVHFACRADLPIGSTLRVTSSVDPPPLLADGPCPLEPVGSGGGGGGGGDDQSSVASGDILGANRRSGLDDMSIARADDGRGGSDHDQRREELRMQSRLLTNTVEMTTTPDEYPLWRTTRPVVVIDTASGGVTETERAELEREGHVVEVPGGLDGEDAPLLHRYRYVAVTPGSVIDWSLVQPREYGDHDSVSTGRGTRTVATTPPGSDDEAEGAEGRGMLAEEEGEPLFD